MTVRHWFVGVAVAGSVALAGCGGTSPAPVPEKRGEDRAAIAANLAKLPAGDRALAEAQRVCPVTGEPLGSMGVPPKLTLKGEAVFLCCASCEKEAGADPEKTLKAVADAKAKSAAK